MIYGDDVTHVLTEEGIANLLLCRSDEEREQAIRGIAGYTPVGLERDRRMVANLRDRGVIRRAEDLGIDKRDATRSLLAARSSATWRARRAGCIGRRAAFATGKGHRNDGKLEVRIRRSQRAGTVRAGAGRRGRLGQSGSPARAQASSAACRFDVVTSARGFGAIWEAVLRDFHARHPYAGVAVSIHDMGATRPSSACGSTRPPRNSKRPESADEPQLCRIDGAAARRPSARRGLVRRDPAAGRSRDESASGAARCACVVRRRRRDRPRPTGRPCGAGGGAGG